MFDTNTNGETTADVQAANNSSPTNDLQQTKADEVSGRPSEGEKNTAQDRLQQNTQTSDEYKALTLPESLKGCEENFASFKQLAATLKLPAETVKKLVEWEASAAADHHHTQEAARADIVQKWTEKTKSMFGVNYGREIARALNAADRFGGAELRELLELTGLGSHPVIVKTFHQISQQISEDQSIGGQSKSSGDKTFAEALYGKAQ